MAAGSGRHGVSKRLFLTLDRLIYPSSSLPVGFCKTNSALGSHVGRLCATVSCPNHEKVTITKFTKNNCVGVVVLRAHVIIAHAGIKS